jgi:DNA-binding MarR family transcriptional regulator
MEPHSATEAAGTAYPELTEAWTGFFAAVRRARGRAASSDGELSLPQYHLLDALLSLPDPRCGEVAEAAGVAASTASRMIDTLERDGLVERRESAADRRVVEVVITARGTELHERKRVDVEAKLDRMFGSLAPAERENAERLLRRLGELVDEL